MTRNKRWLAPVLALFAVASTAAGAATAAEKDARSPEERRAALLRVAGKKSAAVPQLAAALQDENLVVRRTAARLLADLGKPAREALGVALANDDFVVRRTAFWAVCDSLTADSLPYLEKALQDEHPALRFAAAGLLARFEPRTEAVTRLLEVARADKAQEVRAVAARALWPFYKETVSLRDRKDWDHDVKVAQSIPLPKTGWRFQTDTMQDGHLKKWYEVQCDDSQWPTIEIEKAWEPQGFEHDGIAWYRNTIELPARPEHLAVEIRFEAVDECAWVWVNGRYVGQHDIGPDGWTKPFTLDITEDVRWGAKNQITVRVEDSKGAGGIWKPVWIDVLQ